MSLKETWALFPPGSLLGMVEEDGAGASQMRLRDLKARRVSASFARGHVAFGSPAEHSSLA